MSHALHLFAGAWLAAVAPQEVPEIDLVAEFEAICLASRGGVAGVETTARTRGYVPREATQEEEAGSDRGDPPPRVWARGEDDAEVRVVAAPGRMKGPGPWLSVDRCYIAGPGDLTAARAAAGRLTGVDSFRQRDTAVFAWRPTPEGPRAIRQAQFERHAVRMLREQGLQLVLVSQTTDGVTMSYVVAAP